MGLYWPNFSLVFLIHLFLYAGVYCIKIHPESEVQRIVTKEINTKKFIHSVTFSYYHLLFILEFTLTPSEQKPRQNYQLIMTHFL